MLNNNVSLKLIHIIKNNSLYIQTYPDLSLADFTIPFQINEIYNELLDLHQYYSDKVTRVIVQIRGIPKPATNKNSIDTLLTELETLNMRIIGIRTSVEGIVNNTTSLLSDNDVKIALSNNNQLILDELNRLIYLYNEYNDR